MGLTVPLGAALASRLLVFLLQLLASSLAADYDSSSDLYFSGCGNAFVSSTLQG